MYLDAVFHPRLTPDVLKQEGWHYEAESVEEKITYKGVVFNEMKGVYSSPDSCHSRSCFQELFPDTTYGVDSGGDPAAIVDLTWDEVRQSDVLPIGSIILPPVYPLYTPLLPCVYMYINPCIHL